MTARSTVDKGIQLGVETTSGTQVSANRKVANLDIQFAPELAVETFRKPGEKYPSSSVVHEAIMRGSYNGALDYNALIYPLAGLFGYAVTTPSGGTLSRKWRHVPVMSGRDALQKTFTIERGDSAAAQVMTFGQFSSLQLEASKRSGRFSGNLFGRFITSPDGNSLTASPTEVVAKPVAGPQIKVYVDTSYAGIGGTQATGAYAFSFSCGDKFKPFSGFDGTSTFNDVAEDAPPLSFSFKTAHSSQSRSWFNNLTANSTLFIRAIIEGATLEGSIKEKIQLDLAARYKGAPDEDNDGVYGVEYQFEPIYDSTFNTTGGCFLFELINLLTAL